MSAELSAKPILNRRLAAAAECCQVVSAGIGMDGWMGAHVRSAYERLRSAVSDLRQELPKIGYSGLADDIGRQWSQLESGISLLDCEGVPGVQVGRLSEAAAEIGSLVSSALESLRADENGILRLPYSSLQEIVDRFSELDGLTYWEAAKWVRRHHPSHMVLEAARQFEQRGETLPSAKLLSFHNRLANCAIGLFFPKDNEELIGGQAYITTAERLCDYARSLLDRPQCGETANVTPVPSLPVLRLPPIKVNLDPTNPSIEYNGKVYQVKPNVADAFEDMIVAAGKPIGIGKHFNSKPKRIYDGLHSDLCEIIKNDGNKGYYLTVF